MVSGFRSALSLALERNRPEAIWREIREQGDVCHHLGSLFGGERRAHRSFVAEAAFANRQGAVRVVCREKCAGAFEPVFLSQRHHQGEVLAHVNFTVKAIGSRTAISHVNLNRGAINRHVLNSLNRRQSEADPIGGSSGDEFWTIVDQRLDDRRDLVAGSWPRTDTSWNNCPTVQHHLRCLLRRLWQSNKLSNLHIARSIMFARLSVLSRQETRPCRQTRKCRTSTRSPR